MQIDNISKKLTRAMQTPKEKTSAYDTRGVVARIEEDIAWVRLTGSSVETPVRMTIAASKGDVVQVRVSGGTAWLTGNGSAPPTDDTTANKSYKVATQAGIDAAVARDDAAKAYNYASQAEAEAARAKEAADDAEEKAEAAGEAADQALEDAATAKGAADQALEDASQAKDSARTAYTAASGALESLGLVEDVVGVLEKIQKDGKYGETADTVPIPGKWYFVRSGTNPNYIYTVVTNVPTEYVLTRDTAVAEGKEYYTRSGSGTELDPYVYTEVETPVTADIGTYYEHTNSPYTHGYYELISVDSSIQDYLVSRLAVTADGLWVQPSDSSNVKILLSPTEGVKMYGSDGVIAQYGKSVLIGAEESMHIRLTNGQLSFCDGQIMESGQLVDNVVAYINDRRLYITQSVVLDEMQLGSNKWAWKYDDRDGSIFLKWIGV